MCPLGASLFPQGSLVLLLIKYVSNLGYGATLGGGNPVCKSLLIDVCQATTLNNMARNPGIKKVKDKRPKKNISRTIESRVLRTRVLGDTGS